MRTMFRPIVHHMKWPMRIAAFVVHLMHHLAAFFAWTWMLVHVVSSAAQAGIQASRIWEMRILDDIWTEGWNYFSAAGADWGKILAFAVIPAFFVALRNAYTTYEQFRDWVHRPA